MTARGDVLLSTSGLSGRRIIHHDLRQSTRCQRATEPRFHSLHAVVQCLLHGGHLIEQVGMGLQLLRAGYQQVSHTFAGLLDVAALG